MKNISHDYYHYIKDNKTLIAKVYGIYQFHDLQSLPLTIILMENI